MREEGHWNVNAYVNFEHNEAKQFNPFRNITSKYSNHNGENLDFRVQNLQLDTWTQREESFQALPIYLCHTWIPLSTSNQVSTFSALVIVVLLCRLTSQITNPLMLE